MEIENISRGDIIINDDGIKIRILGEAMMPKQKPELSEYVIYENSITYLDSKKNVSDKSLKEKVINFLITELPKKGMKAIIE